MKEMKESFSVNNNDIIVPEKKVDSNFEIFKSLLSEKLGYNEDDIDKIIKKISEGEVNKKELEIKINNLNKKNPDKPVIDSAKRFFDKLFVVKEDNLVEEEKTKNKKDIILLENIEKLKSGLDKEFSKIVDYYRSLNNAQDKIDTDLRIRVGQTGDRAFLTKLEDKWSHNLKNNIINIVEDFHNLYLMRIVNYLSWTPNEMGIEDLKKQIKNKELISRIDLAVMREKVNIGEIVEKIKTIVFHDALGSEYLIVRSSKNDDTNNKIDNVIINKESGDIVGAIDDAVGSVIGIEKKKKKTNIINFGELGTCLQDVIKLEDGKIVRSEKKENIPIFYLCLSYENILKYLESLNSGENITKEIFSEFKTVLMGQLIETGEKMSAEIEEKENIKEKMVNLKEKAKLEDRVEKLKLLVERISNFKSNIENKN